MRSVHRLRYLATAGLAGVLFGMLAAVGPVPAAFGSSQAAQKELAVAAHNSVVIDGVSPRIATPSSTIHVTGTLTNGTGQPMQGLQVQLYSLATVFTSPSQMTSYVNGGATFGNTVGTPAVISDTVPAGATVHWTASLQPDTAGFSQFGVYPLEAGLMSPLGSTLATARTFLPYWPGKQAADRLRVSWVWPLIDDPQQGPCQGMLATNSLASSLSGGGRLGTLLSAGISHASASDLTWAVDPALLSDAQVMTGRYRVGGNTENCSGGQSEPANAAASAWLARLRSGTAAQPMFVTPYADVDVSALSHGGLDGDLRDAYTLGDSVAAGALSRNFGKVGWPAAGTADASVLTSLARYGQVSTVVLNSEQMPSTGGSFAYDAVASVTTGIGTTMHVLLANNDLTTMLGTAGSSSPGAEFAVEQEFLAETAMIAAEDPYVARSVVVAPPRRWNPPAAVANELLAETSSTPWLRPAKLSSLASSPQVEQHQQPPDNQVTRSELSRSYLGQVKATDSSLQLYKTLLQAPAPAYLQTLQAAVAGTESSAWRGDGATAGKQALGRLSAYLSTAETDIKIIPGPKVTLAGVSGDVPVSVFNSGQQAVQVRVIASPASNRLSVGKFKSLVTIGSNATNTVRLPISSTALGSTIVQLQLVTKNGSPLAWTSESLSVQSTRYGRALLVLIGAALGVLVFASAVRWIRQWLADGKAGGTG